MGDSTMGVQANEGGAVFAEWIKRLRAGPAFGSR
jgi:hypothetical protein